MPLQGYFNLLRLGGTIVCEYLQYESCIQPLAYPHLPVVGAPDDPIPPMKLWALIRTNIHMTGSAIGSPHDINEMFDVAVKHNIRPWIQKVSDRT